MRRFFAILFFAAIWSPAMISLVVAQGSPRPGKAVPDSGKASPLETRAREVGALFRADPGDYDKVFNAAFLAQIPTTQLTSLFSGIFTQAGRCTAAKVVEKESPYSGDVEFTFASGATASASLTVEAGEPHLVAGLFIHPLAAAASSLDDIIKDLQALPGETAFLFAKLERGKVVAIAGRNPDKELAIGSTFKLYILAELLRAVKAGERKLSDVVPLDAGAISWPSGILQNWPPGSPLTLQTMASLMISMSDNTAADQLLKTLGRERVERIQAAAGHGKPELNMPFFSTLELFKLKAGPGDKATARYLALDQKGRRAFLEKEIAARSREEAKPSGNGQPVRIDSLEWFASANDLCRLMNYLRENTETDARTKPIRQVLAISPGLQIPSDKWRYAGYKGGSEPGVISMTYVLQSVSGDWYAVSMTWNNKQAPLDEGKFAGLMQRVLQIAKGP